MYMNMEENPQSTSTLVASENQVSQTTILHILRKENYHPYKFQLAQELNEDDPDRRLHVLSKRHSELNPHCIIEAHTQHPQKLNIWAVIVANRIIGPFLFEETLTGERYLEFLQNDIVPALAVIFPYENDPDIPDNTLWFQQDGAPPHYARSVLEYLHVTGVVGRAETLSSLFFLAAFILYSKAARSKKYT
ncbi:hypothetical protein NQ318_012109, partial [Aromia moschata]